MTKIRKITETIWGVIMILFSIAMVLFSEYAYPFIMAALTLGFIFYGFKSLIYYFTMARFMVGGKVSLYRAVILLDFGFLTFSLNDIPKIYILLYLVAINAFAGLVELLRASESRKQGSSWKLKFSHALINIFLALACIIFIRKVNTAIYIYCFGIFYLGIIRIVTAFRKTTFIYIQ